MNKQTKLIITGVAVIGAGILIYNLLKPKKKKLAAIDLVNTTLMKDKIKSLVDQKNSNVLPRTDYSKTLNTTRQSSL
jgi:hypothetical protein